MTEMIDTSSIIEQLNKMPLEERAPALEDVIRKLEETLEEASSNTPRDHSET